MLDPLNDFILKLMYYHLVIVIGFLGEFLQAKNNFSEISSMIKFKLSCNK